MSCAMCHRCSDPMKSKGEERWPASKASAAKLLLYCSNRPLPYPLDSLLVLYDRSIFSMSTSCSSAFFAVAMRGQ